MSLKAIKDVLELLETHIEDNGPCDHGVNICSCGERRTLNDATGQVAALEKAAIGLYENGLIDEGVTEGAEEATATMRRIAEEAEG